MQELNATCVNFSWILPAESGADRFKIAYGILKGKSDNMIKIEVPHSQQQIDLCNRIIPGYTYIFAVIAEKSNQISDASTISHTIKPLSAEDLKVLPDFDKGKYRIEVILPSKEQSKIDKCLISVSSEKLEKMDDVTKVEEFDNEKVRCISFMQLSPGQRYEISAATQSGQSVGTKIFRSLAVDPGFNMKSFGLILAENKGILRLEWPPSEVAMLKIKDLWSKIVGNNTQLHLKVDPHIYPTTISTSPLLGQQGLEAQMKDSVRQVETTPSAAETSVIVDHLRRGACYKIQMYTVTSSGIVSTNRFEQYLRMSAPIVNLDIDQITKNTAVLKINVVTNQDKQYAVSADISDCNFNVVVMDTQSTIIYDRTLRMQDSTMPSILLEGLRPFHKYSINSQIICGDSSDHICGQKTRTISQLTFETSQDRPGPVQNLSVKALNPYSVQASWLPPALPNGVITHYVINVHPTDPSEKPWTVNVGANVNSVYEKIVEAVVDNLVGGQNYQINAQAVTEAGIGDLPAASDSIRIEMPIMGRF